MDEHEMVLRCLETFSLGYAADTRLVEINWIHWNEERTPEIRCVFISVVPRSIRCVVYPTISRTHGVNLDSGQSWKLPD